MGNVNNKNLKTEELVEKCNVWRLQTKTNNELKVLQIIALKMKS